MLDESNRIAGEIGRFGRTATGGQSPGQSGYEKKNQPAWTVALWSAGHV